MATRVTWRIARAGFALAAVLLITMTHYPAVALDDAEIQRGRAKALNDILTGDLPGLARWERSGCALENRAAEVTQARAEGKAMVPDAGDGCVAALTRQARDGALMSLYQDIIALQRPDKRPGAASVNELLGRLEATTHAQSGSNDPDVAALPQRVIAAIQDGSNRVDLGAGKLLAVTSGLAMDIGFTAAYWAGEGAHPATINDRAKFAQMTENCVSQRGDIKLCFSVGYVHGAAAFATSRRSAAR